MLEIIKTEDFLLCFLTTKNGDHKAEDTSLKKKNQGSIRIKTECKVKNIKEQSGSL